MILRPVKITFEIVKCGWTNWNHKIKEKKKVKRGNKCFGKWSRYKSK